MEKGNSLRNNLTHTHTRNGRGREGEQTNCMCVNAHWTVTNTILLQCHRWKWNHCLSEYIACRPRTYFINNVEHVSLHVLYFCFHGMCEITGFCLGNKEGDMIFCTMTIKREEKVRLLAADLIMLGVQVYKGPIPLSIVHKYILGYTGILLYCHYHFFPLYNAYCVSRSFFHETFTAFVQMNENKPIFGSRVNMNAHADLGLYSVGNWRIHCPLEMVDITSAICLLVSFLVLASSNIICYPWAHGNPWSLLVLVTGKAQKATL